MLNVNMSQGVEAQYNIPDDVAEFINDFFDNAKDIVIDEAYIKIISKLLTDLFENKLPKNGVISEEEVNDLIEKSYLGDASKFKFSANGDSARGVRMTGSDSGYFIELNYNNQGIDDPITFQITSISADLIFVRGGVPGGKYINKEMDANSAIQLLLSF